MPEMPRCFIVITVSNQDQRIPFSSELNSLNVHLGDQRTSRVNHSQFAQFALLPDFGGNAVRAVDDALPLRNLTDAINKDGALLLKFFHHEPVVDDLFADINRRPKGFQCNPDNIDGPHHSSAESSRLQQQ